MTECCNQSRISDRISARYSEARLLTKVAAAVVAKGDSVVVVVGIGTGVVDKIAAAKSMIGS